MSNWLASPAGVAQQFLRGEPTSHLSPICCCRPRHLPQTSQRSVIRSETATATRRLIRLTPSLPKATIQPSIFGALLELRHRLPQLLRPTNRIFGLKTGRERRPVAPTESVGEAVGFPGTTTSSPTVIGAHRAPLQQDRQLRRAGVDHDLNPSVFALFVD